MTPEEREARFLQAIRDGADVYMNTDDYNDLPKSVSDGNVDAANIWASSARVYPCAYLDRGEMIAISRREK